MHETRWNDGAFTTQLESLVWTASPIVRRYLHWLATGNPDLDWLTSVRFRYLPVIVHRALVLGCGSGWLERALATPGGGIRSIVACDFAQETVERAREKAESEGKVIACDKINVGTSFKENEVLLELDATELKRRISEFRRTYLDGKKQAHIELTGGKPERLANVEQLSDEDRAALFDRGYNGREVVVDDHNLGGILRRFRAHHPHGDADVGANERRSVVHAISGHRHDVAPLLIRLDDAKLLRGMDACED